MLQLTSLLNFDRLNQIERELDIKISYLALILCVCVCVCDKGGYLDLFEYLTILSSICSSVVPHTVGITRKNPIG